MNLKIAKGKNLSCLLAALFAFALAETAQAATDIYWKTDKVGGSESSPYFLKDAGNWQSNGPAGDNKAIHFNITGARTYISSSGVESRTCNDFTPEAGDFVFIGDMNFYCLKGGAANTTVSIVKKGDWTVSSKYHFYAAHSNNSKFILTNETGNLTTQSGSNVSLADAANSEGEIVNHAGDWTVSGSLLLASASGAKAKVVKNAGNWNMSGDVKLAEGSGANASFTNIAGNLTMPTGKYLQIAKGASSSAHVEKTGGNWTCGTIQVGQGDGATGTFRHSGGWLDVKGTYGLCIACNNSSSTLRGLFELAGGAVTNSTGNVNIGDGGAVGSLGTLRTTGGELYVKTGQLRIGNSAAAVLDMNGGVVTAPNGVRFCANNECTSGEDCTANLNSGTLAATVVDYGSGSAAATFNFNGGTLKALQAGTLITQHNNLTVNVDAGGAIIDTDSKAVSILSPLNSVSATGDLTVTGGGTLTASGDLTGAFTIGENTTLHYFDQDGAVANYAISSISIAPGATLYLDADATGCDTFGAVTTNITATSANPAKITLVFASAAPAGTSYTLFNTVDGSEFNVKPMLGALELPHETSVVNGKLTLTITAEDYTWNGSQTNWGDADAWTKGGASASWSDGNNAIFDTAGREAVVSAAASASEVRFTANAAISGTAALSASKIIVEEGSTATISAPFGSAVQKTGAGTLALAQTPANTLTLIGGTLSMDGGEYGGIPATTSETDATLANGIYGAENGAIALPYGTLRFANDAILTNQLSVSIASDVGGTAGIVKNGGDWTVSENFLLGRAQGASSTFIQNGGTLNVGGYFSVGDLAGAGPARMEINGGTVNSTHGSGFTEIGASCEGTCIVRNGGVLNVTAGWMLVGYRSNGTLTIDDGGTVNVDKSDIVFAGHAEAGNALVELKTGGTLVVNRIYYSNNNASGVSTIRFDGGTVKCKYTTLISAHDRLFVKVASNGGIIDLQGKTVAIEEPLLEDAESTGGGMTFKGGGVVTLASGNTYTGNTTVEVGTTVHVPTPGEIGGGIAVTVPETTPADGVYTLVAIDGEGEFTDAVLTGVVTPANATLRLSGDRKSILCIYGNPPNTWVGGASGSLNDNANWSLGTVPASGESCVIGNLTAASLTNSSGSAFAPASITFPADTALVTISGEGVISGITAITNNASLHHVFNCPVVCADNITPDITRGSGNYMTFAGGITMYNAPKTGSSTTDYWSGNITVTTEDEQEFKSSGSKNYAQLVSGTTFSFDNGIIDHMQIYPGATAVVNRLVYNGCARSSTTSKKTAWFNLIFDNGNGVLRAKEIKATGDAVLFHSYADSDQHGGTIIAEKLTCATTKRTSGGGWDWPLFFLNCSHTTGSGFIGNAANGEGVWVIGHGGLSFGSGAIEQSFYGLHLGKTLDNGRPAATLHSYEDWALDVHPLGASQNALEISSGHGELLVIDTSHYAVGDPVLDAATSHTVTLNGKVKGDGAMRVDGNGKVVFANANNTFAGTLAVADTATVEVKAGNTLGTCAVTMGSGTTLAVAESGTATVGGNLTLNDGACLGFNFTNRTTAPTLAIASGKTVTASGTVKVKVSGIWPKGGTYPLTSGGGFAGVAVALDETDKPKWAAGVSVDETTGNIVLEVKPRGTAIIVR